jgi:hypothetical protein
MRTYSCLDTDAGELQGGNVYILVYEHAGVCSHNGSVDMIFDQVIAARFFVSVSKRA